MGFGFFGKSNEKYNKDAKKLQKCFDDFSDQIKELSFGTDKKIDEIKYCIISNLYENNFRDYLKSSKRHSRTNDVLKEIEKKITAFDNLLILKQTYDEYCECYDYDRTKCNKDAAIDSEIVIRSHSEMMKTLLKKLKDIVSLNDNKSIETSATYSLKEHNVKLKNLFDKFNEFESSLDSLELKAGCQYKSISDVFYDAFQYNIQGRYYDNKSKWFSHTNNVFKSIYKKLKPFDKKCIMKDNYKKYVECFKYDPKKINKKASIDDKDVFMSFQKLNEKILTKLEGYFKNEFILLALNEEYEDFEKAVNNFKNEINIDKINSCSDFGPYLQEHFGKIRYTSGKINYLFKKFINNKREFNNTEVDNYTKNIQDFPSNSPKKVKNKFTDLKNFIEEKIKERVRNIKEELEQTYKIWNVNVDRRLTLDYLYNFYLKQRGKFICIAWELVENLNLKFKNNFIIGGDNCSLGSTWRETNSECFPNLKTITIDGKNKILQRIEGKVFDGLKSLEKIEFKNVIVKYSLLSDIKEKLGVNENCEIIVYRKKVENFIERKENDIRETLNEAIQINEFTQDAFSRFLKEKFNEKLYDKEFTDAVYSDIKELTFKIDNITIPKEPVIDPSAFKSLETINFYGKLVGIDKGATKNMGFELLQKVTFDDYDSEHVKLEDITTVFKGCEEITIGDTDIKTLIKNEENKIKETLRDIEINEFTKSAFLEFLNKKFKKYSKEFIDVVYSKVKSLTFKIDNITIPKEPVINPDVFKSLGSVNFKGELVEIDKNAGYNMGLNSSTKVTFNKMVKPSLCHLLADKTSDCLINDKDIYDVIDEIEEEIENELLQGIEINAFTQVAFSNFLKTKFNEKEEFTDTVCQKIKELTFKIGEIGITNEQVIDPKLFGNLKNINFKGKLTEIDKGATENMGLESLEKVTFDNYDSENVKLEDITTVFKYCEITINNKNIGKLIKEEQEGQQQETN